MVGDAVLRFAEFTLSSFELRRGGTLIATQPQLLAILNHFARHPAHVVSRDELRPHVWPAINVSDSAVNKAVSRAKALIDDDGDQERFIRSVRGTGWVWVFGEVLVDDGNPQGDRFQAASAPLVTCKGLLDTAESALERGDVATAQPLVLQSIEIARARQAVALLTRARCDLGACQLQAGDFKAAQATFEALVSVARDRKDIASVALYLNNLGIAQRRGGDVESSRATLVEAVALAGTVPDNQIIEIKAALALARTYAAMSDVALAREQCERAVAISRAANNDRLLARSLREYALACSQHGDYDGEVVADAESLSLAMESGSDTELQVAYQHLGVALFNRGDYGSARASFREAYQLANGLQLVDSQIHSLIALGRCHLRLRNAAGAIDIFQAALRVAEDVRDHVSIAQVLVNLGSAWTNVRSTSMAVDTLSQVRDSARGLADLRTEAVACCDIGVALVAEQQPTKAIPYFFEALQLAQKVQDSKEEAQYLRNLAFTFGDLRRPEAVDFAVAAVGKAHAAFPPSDSRHRIQALAQMLRRKSLRSMAFDRIATSTTSEQALGRGELSLALTIQ